MSVGSGSACLRVAALSLVAATPAPAGQYAVVDLGTLGGSYSRANAISESGTIAGLATTTQGVQHAVLWDETGIVDLGAPAGFTVGEAVDVNDLGQVAGNGEGSPQTIKAYLWADGIWTPLGTLPGLNESIAEGIDANGRIVGRSLTLGGGGQSGFIWEEGVMTDLGTLGGSAGAYGVNDLGQVVGRSQAILPDDSLGHRAFIWQEGRFTDLGVLPGEDFSQAFGVNELGDVAGSSWIVTTPNFLSADQATLWRDGGEEAIDLGLTPGPEVCVSNFPFYTDNIARAVNNCGQVVGHAQCVASGGAKAAFLWQDGVMHNLNDLAPGDSGLELISALDINDAGQIVGLGITPGGQLHGFLLQPQPTGDVDGDGIVGIDDFLFLLGNWGPCPESCCPADLDRDGDVGISDFLLLLGSWG